MFFILCVQFLILSENRGFIAHFRHFQKQVEPEPEPVPEPEVPKTPKKKKKKKKKPPAEDQVLE